MPGPAGTITRLVSPTTLLSAAVVEDTTTAELDAPTTDLVRRHGAAAVTAAAAAALLAARERDRLDTFDAEVFGIDRSTPTPLDLTAATSALAAAPPAAPVVDEAAFDAFEAATFGLPR